MLHLGHAVDYVSKSYNIAVLHACLGGIGLQLYLGLLCLAVPVITGICADGDEFFHFCAASAGGSLELGLMYDMDGMKVWSVIDYDSDKMYLIKGSKGALLIDAGMAPAGANNLYEYCKQLAGTENIRRLLCSILDMRSIM